MKNILACLEVGEKEMSVFLKMLELGAQPVSVIAKQAGQPRSTMYLILERLKKAGLVEEFERAGIMYVRCIPVIDIPGIVKMKEAQVHEGLVEIQKALPKLEALENRLSITPKVRFFEGVDGVMKAYREMLNEKFEKGDVLYAYFNPAFVKKMMPKYHFKIPETFKEKGIKAQELLADSADAREYKKMFLRKGHEIKILPKNVKLTADTILWNNKIYMVSYGEKEMVATEIWNTSLYNSQKAFFELMWRKC